MRGGEGEGRGGGWRPSPGGLAVTGRALVSSEGGASSTEHGGLPSLSKVSPGFCVARAGALCLSGKVQQQCGPGELEKRGGLAGLGYVWKAGSVGVLMDWTGV